MKRITLALVPLYVCLGFLIANDAGLGIISSNPQNVVMQAGESMFLDSNVSIDCPEDIVVDASSGECGAIVYFDDALTAGTTPKDQIILLFEGDKRNLPIYEESGMRLQGLGLDHIDAPWPIECDNRQGALIHPFTGNTWTYNNGEPFTPDQVYVCTTNMKFTTGDCETVFIPTKTGNVNFPDTPEWQNITSMTWEETGGVADASIDDFRFTPTSLKQTAGLESGCFFPVGTTLVEFTLTNDDGTLESCSFNVIVRDVENPVVSTHDTSIALDANFKATITPSDVLTSTPSDNCGIDSIILSKENFDCGDIGDTVVEVKVTDVNGNVTTNTVTVTITGSVSAGNIDPIEDGVYCNEFIFPQITGTDVSGNPYYSTKSDGTGEIFIEGDVVSFSDTAVYPLTFYVIDPIADPDTCSEQQSFEVTITSKPALEFVATVQACGSYVLPEIIGSELTGNQAYFTQPNGMGTRYEAGDTIERSSNTTYPIIFYIYDSAANGCDDQVQFNIDLTVCNVDASIQSTASDICDNEMEFVILTTTASPETPRGTYRYMWQIVGDPTIIGTTPEIEVLPSTTTTYKVTVTDDQSIAARPSDTDQITITVNEAPVAAAPMNLIICNDSQNAEVKDITLSDYNEAVSMGNFENEITYHANQQDANQAINALSDQQEISLGTTTYFARITNPQTGCYDTTSVTLELVFPPSLEAVLTPIALCQDDQDVVVSTTIRTALDPTTHSFQWAYNDGSGYIVLDHTADQLEVNEPGTYLVTATDLRTGCETEKEVVISVIKNPITATATAALSAILDNHTIEVEVRRDPNSPALYEVQLEDGLWVEMNQNTDVFTYAFTNVPTGDGIQEVRIRGKNGCFDRTLQVITLGIPQFVTPNGDGFNETWNIKGLEVLQQKSQLFVFDRYGKLLADLTLQGNGWDGTFNGAPLPSSDYWYRLDLEDGQVLSGHFTLKR